MLYFPVFIIAASRLRCPVRVVFSASAVDDISEADAEPCRSYPSACLFALQRVMTIHSSELIFVILDMSVTDSEVYVHLPMAVEFVFPAAAETCGASPSLTAETAVHVVMAVETDVEIAEHRIYTGIPSVAILS